MTRISIGLLGLIGGLSALNGACINCSERIEDTIGWIEVEADEACPAVDDSLYLTYSGDELLSIDGSGKKHRLAPRAWSR